MSDEHMPDADATRKCARHVHGRTDVRTDEECTCSPHKSDPSLRAGESGDEVPDGKALYDAERVILGIKRHEPFAVRRPKDQPKEGES